MRFGATIGGVGLVGPGMASWSAAAAMLSGRAAYEMRPTVLHSPDALPAAERRRAGKCVRLALAAGLEAAAHAGRDARDLVAIFASSTGEGENLHAICEALASDDRLISPTRFHNSVHNAPAGYWGIATGSMHPADSLAAFDGSFGAALLEALGRCACDPAQPVLLVAYDAPYPEPLNAKRPTSDAFALALVLGGAGDGQRIEVELTHETPAKMDDARLEALRCGIPAARALPFLAQLAAGEPARTVIEYLDGLAIAMALRP